MVVQIKYVSAHPTLVHEDSKYICQSLYLFQGSVSNNLSLMFTTKSELPWTLQTKPLRHWKTDTVQSLSESQYL